jgi:hypothetical protein
MGEFDEDAVDESEIDEEDKDAFDAVSSKESDADEDDNNGDTFVWEILSLNGASTLQSTPLSLIIYGSFSITIQSFDDYSRFCK